MRWAFETDLSRDDRLLLLVTASVPSAQEAPGFELLRRRSAH